MRIGWTDAQSAQRRIGSSIGHKYTAIAKLQEELLVLSMRKDRVATDMEKVSTYKIMGKMNVNND